MNIKSKLGNIDEKLKEARLDTTVEIVKIGNYFSKKNGLQVLVRNVSESSYIDTFAQVQKILTGLLGYGTVKSDYSFDSSKLVVEFVPLQNVRVASTASNYVRDSSEERSAGPKHRIGTPGFTYIRS
jgi:hypothetical protein